MKYYKGKMIVKYYTFLRESFTITLRVALFVTPIAIIGCGESENPLGQEPVGISETPNTSPIADIPAAPSNPAERETYTEGDTIPVVLILSNPIGTGFTVEWEVKPGAETEGTSADGSDYSGGSGSRDITPDDGLRIHLGDIQLIKDNVVEGPEIFDIHLTGVLNIAEDLAQRITLGEPKRIKIVDNHDDSGDEKDKDKDGTLPPKTVDEKDKDKDGTLPPKMVDEKDKDKDGTLPPKTVDENEAGKGSLLAVDLPDPNNSHGEENWTSALEKMNRIRGGIAYCLTGWKKTDGFGNPTPRVILHAVEVAIDMDDLSGIYKPVAIEIYADPTENLVNLDGWKLTLALPYNLANTDYYLTAEDSTFNEDGIARIESPAENPFPMADVQFSGRWLPGFDYRLFDENNVAVDFGISCYRHAGLQDRLQAMETPRVERDIIPPATNDEELERISWRERLDWEDNYYLSIWLVPKVVPAVPGAPAAVRKPLTTSWAALKDG